MKKVSDKKEIQSDFTENNILNQISSALYAGRPLSGENGVITQLIKKALEASLEGELESHLSENSLEEGGNRRNGFNSKNVNSSLGSFDLDTPRDRQSSFEPQLVKKRQTILNEELDTKVLALYGLGNSYNEISFHVKDLYGIEISPATISSITDKLIPQITEWRNRPLEATYPIIFLDAMFFKVRDNAQVQTKVLYNILGINQEGFKEVLGFYVAESEGANFWLGVLNDLKARGVEDVLIACVDGLKGFPEAIQASFPNTEVQLCIVHQIRNSLKFIVSKNQKEFMQDLKTVYQAETKDLAELNLLRLDEKWGQKYPMVLKSWQNNWENLSTYFKYSQEIRKLIYTTNPIEGLHRQIRKYTKTKGAFTSENALFKLVFCAINYASRKWSQPVHNWALSISQLDIFFPHRLSLR